MARRGPGNRRANPKDDAAELWRAERRAKIVEYRGAGLTWRAIAAKLDVSHALVHAEYKRAIAERPVAALEEHRAEADATLRMVIAAHAKPKAIVSPKSALVLVRAVATHAKIFGYAAPDKVEHSGSIDVTRLSDEELRQVVDGTYLPGGGRTGDAAPAAGGDAASGVHPDDQPEAGEPDVDGSDR